MGQRVDHGFRLTEADRFEIQRRVTAGETFAAAAAAVGCSTKSIQRFMRHTGGMRPDVNGDAMFDLHHKPRAMNNNPAWCVFRTRRHKFGAATRRRYASERGGPPWIRAERITKGNFQVTSRSCRRRSAERGVTCARGARTSSENAMARRRKSDSASVFARSPRR
jgi:hypothetical protein